MGENRRRRTGKAGRKKSVNKVRTGLVGGTGRAGKRRSRRAEVLYLDGRKRKKRAGPSLARGSASSGGSGSGSVGRRRVRLAVAVVAASGLLLCGRAADLSFTGDTRYQALAAEQSLQAASPEPGQGRGDIISADGRKLATTLNGAQVVATPYQIQDPDKVAQRLEGVIGGAAHESVAQIKASLTERDSKGRLGGYSVVAQGLDPDTAAKVRDLGIEGITTLPSAIRTYPDGALASQLLGHVGGYAQPFGGVEAGSDKSLKSGKDVKLTLDTAVQQKLQSSLSKTAKKYGAKDALGLVMRVDNGDIVALANTPGYNNNDFSKSPAENQRNRVITDAYEPGSTFKAFTMSAAIQEGAVTPRSKFVVPDQIPVADRIIHDSLPHPTKIMTPANILQESSNVGTTEIARRLGASRLDEYIKRFGFGKPTGVDLPGENPGVVPPLKDWSGSSIGNLPIGQGETVTPLQLAAGYSAIANGGYKVTPHVLQGDSTGKRGSRVITSKTSSIVKRMLESVVERGTGVHAQIPGYTVAGKTGTSQKVDPKTGTYTDKYIASFIGFAPASNPKYITLIVLDNPVKDMWGETTAAPAFSDVMGFTLQYYNVPPDAGASGTKSARNGGAG